MSLGGCSIGQALRPQTYAVQRGDTLYTIGVKYHIDWHDLARWNHIDPPYRLDVGQRLSLDPYPPLNYAHMPSNGGTSGTGITSRAPNAGPAAGRQQADDEPTPQLHRTIQSQQPSSKPQPPAESTVSSTGQSAPTNRDRAENTGNSNNAENAGNADDSQISATSAAHRDTPVKAAGPSEDGWQWPATGSLLRAYDPSDRRQGIEIGGTLGAPIYAASSGKVVYSGSGLKGYGKLIIIKHDEHYLSAYGFNRRSRVKQGQTVAAGAQIADMGLGPGNQPMLHFEIRHDGDPIDPESVLPKR